MLEAAPVVRRTGKAACPRGNISPHCYIAGNVDFIFGDSKAVFDRSGEIHSTPHAGRLHYRASRTLSRARLRLRFESLQAYRRYAGVTSNVFLGRPWRPYATVVYLHTETDDKIDPAGWREWHPAETRSLDTAFYAEHGSTGPGAHPTERDPHSKFLTPEQARQFETSVFLRGSDNWNPLVLPKPPK